MFEQRKLPQGNVDEHDMIEVPEQAVLLSFYFFITVTSLHLII